MEWSDEGIVISVRAHGETAAVVELFTRANGRHMGLVHGGRSRRLRPVLQIGNHVEARWRARVSESLGHFAVELRRGYAADAMNGSARLAAVSSMCSLLRLLPERDPHANLFEITLFVLSYIDDDDVWPALLVRWELALLEELGFGLDLSACAATGSTDELVYVSPKTGRAVSAEAGEPYKDRLLRLPAFLVKKSSGSVGDEDVLAGLTLSGHFLETRVFLPREQAMPEPRGRLGHEISRLR